MSKSLAAAAAAANAAQPVNVTSEPTSLNQPAIPGATFEGLGIAPRIRSAILRSGWSTPREVQYQAIPPILAGQDVIGLASTGSGKTGAYGLALVQRIVTAAEQGGIRGLVIVPTRELAEQVTKELRKIAADSDVVVRCFIGGIPSNYRFSYRPTSIVVGTPGKLYGMIADDRLIDVSKVAMVVIDEFDRALQTGMFDDIATVHALTAAKRQTVLFSATMAPHVRSNALSLLNKPVTIGSTVPKVPEQIKHIAFHVDGMSQKHQLLLTLLRNGDVQNGVIFVRTKDSAEELCLTLRREGFSATYLSSKITSQEQRSHNLGLFLSGQVDFLVATDVAGRGIDYGDCLSIVNFDFPLMPEDYVHRAGRTGRNGHEGTVITFASGREFDTLAGMADGSGFPVDQRSALEIESRPNGRPNVRKRSLAAQGEQRSTPVERPVAETAGSIRGISQELQLPSIRRFEQFDLRPRILDLLPDAGLQIPTEFESVLIPAIAAGQSLLGVGPVGSSRIAALMLPIFDALLRRPQRDTAALVLMPTDAVAFRLWRQIESFTHPLRLWTAGVFDSSSDEHLQHGFRKTPALIVASPEGLTRAVQENYASLGNVRTLVLGDADRILSRNSTRQMLNDLLPFERLQSVLIATTYWPEFAGQVKKMFPRGKIYGANAEIIGDPVDRSGKVSSTHLFDHFELDHRLLRALAARDYVKPTEIQTLLIPALQRGERVLGLAPTGTGKTAAYMLPILNALSRQRQRNTAALILAPTDVLGAQLVEELETFGRGLGLPVAGVFDGSSDSMMERAFLQTPAIIVGTPGAVLEAEYRNLANLVDVRFVMIDEADALLAGDQMRELLYKLPPIDELQIALISATFSPEMEGRVPSLLPGGKIYNANFETPLQEIRHSAYQLLEAQKFPMLMNILIEQNPELLIAFCETADKCDFLVQRLRERMIRCAAIHAGIPALDRSVIMQDFRDREFQVLVATGEIARGLDVKGVSHVVHVDPPSTLEEYRHRAGRTGRAGQEGRSIIFALPWEEWDTKTMLNMLKIEADWPPKPDLISPLDDRFRLDFGPQEAIDAGQEALGHAFQRPGLLLSGFHRNRFYEDPREKVTMLNVIGRALVPLAISDIVFEHVPDTNVYAVKQLIQDFSHGPMIESASIGLGLDRFTRPDKRAEKIHGTYVPNVEQTFYNCLGAIFLDSGSTVPVKNAVARALLQPMSSRVLQLERHVQQTDYSLGAEVRVRFEKTLGHTFSNSNWLNMAVEGFTLGDKTRAFSSRLLATGGAVMYFTACDIVRRGCFDWPSTEMHEKRRAMAALDGVWQSPMGIAVSHCLQETFGWRYEIGKLTVRDVLRSLAGALYADGGIEPAARFGTALFPEAEGLIEAGKNRVRVNADLPALQRQLDLEGELRDKHRAAKQQADRQREKARAAASERDAQKREVERHNGPNYKADLQLRVQTESLGKLRYHIRPSSNGDGAVFDVSIRLGKKEISAVSGVNEEAASQEAARLALTKIDELYPPS